MRSTIVELYDQFKGNVSGALADYIPQLATVAPDQFGIALTSNQGKTVWIGDASAFPTASGTNPMATILALSRRTAHAIASA